MPMVSCWPIPPTLMALQSASASTRGSVRLDPERMAHAVVDEAIRNVVAVGADPDKVALLDNFSWGDPRRQSTLGELVAAVAGLLRRIDRPPSAIRQRQGLAEQRVPRRDGARHSVPPTLVITAIAHVPDANAVVTPDLKQPGNVVVQIGTTACEFGGSHFAKVHDMGGPATVPAPDATAPTRYRRLHQALRSGRVVACHDLSEGGLAVALAEMAIAGRLGLSIDTLARPRSGVGVVQRIVGPFRVRDRCRGCDRGWPNNWANR